MYLWSIWNMHEFFVFSNLTALNTKEMWFGVQISVVTNFDFLKIFQLICQSICLFNLALIGFAYYDYFILSSVHVFDFINSTIFLYVIIII